MNEALSPGTPRVFEVRYGPKDQPAFNRRWPNNLELEGGGTVEVTADAVKFSDGRHASNAAQRSFAMADIANVGIGESGTESVIAVRTRSDDREVLVWIASRDQARELLELLPRATTPEFLAREQQHRKFHENLRAIAPRAPVTPAIVGINVAVFLLLLAMGAGFMQTDGRVESIIGSNFGPLTWSSQPWRLLSAAFIHFGVIHLAFNMYALYNGGVLTEKLYGSTRFAVIYLLAALAGSVVSGWWDATRNSAGASGAVFGVYGALLVFIWRRPRDIPRDVLKSVRSGALTLLVYSLALGAILRIVDNAAHVGGLLGGALTGLLLVRPFDSAARTAPHPVRVTAVCLVVLAALSVLAVPLWRGTIR